jgi:hypothetical protein
MSEQNQTNDSININFDVRYKEGKVDQMIMKLGATVAIENQNTLGETLNKTLKHLLLRIKFMFDQIPMKQGISTMVNVDDFIASVIKKLEDENCA